VTEKTMEGIKNKMSLAHEELPLVFDRILDEMEKKGGQITTDEFKKMVYGLRYTVYDIINELYDIEIDREKVKAIFDMTRFSKHDVKEIKNWLNTNGYITINHGYQKETLELKK